MVHTLPLLFMPHFLLHYITEIIDSSSRFPPPRPRPTSRTCCWLLSEFSNTMVSTLHVRPLKPLHGYLGSQWFSRCFLLGPILWTNKSQLWPKDSVGMHLQFSLSLFLLWIKFSWRQDWKLLRSFLGVHTAVYIAMHMYVAFEGPRNVRTWQNSLWKSPFMVCLVSLSFSPSNSNTASSIWC